MPAPYHNLLSKGDRALMAYIIAQEAGTAADVFPAKKSRDHEGGDYTICYSEKASPIGPGTYLVTASVMVKTVAPPDVEEEEEAPRLESEDRVAKTFDAFHRVDDQGKGLDQEITTAARALAVSDPSKHRDLADFTMQDIRITSVEASFEEDTDVWVDTLNVEFVACPSNVS